MSVYVTELKKISCRQYAKYYPIFYKIKTVYVCIYIYIEKSLKNTDSGKWLSQGSDGKLTGVFYFLLYKHQYFFPNKYVPLCY